MKKLLALGLALAVAGVAGLAHAEHGTDVTHPNLDRPERPAPQSMPDGQPEIPNGAVIGQVLAVDPDNGAVLLATEEGVLALQGSPEDVAELEVGDVIAVQLEEDEEEGAAPPTH
jgi:hypothetical protein